MEGGLRFLVQPSRTAPNLLASPDACGHDAGRVGELMKEAAAAAAAGGREGCCV